MGLTAAAGWVGAGCSPPLSPLGPPPTTIGGPAPGGRDLWARHPRSFNSRVTAEIADLPLTVVGGALPADLAGHVLFQSLSMGPNDVGFGGDSMIWRIDLDAAGAVATSRLLRTADYLMYEAFADTPFAFHGRGMARAGPLGMQNQTNTAIVPLGGNRLIATIDAGRPWEFDPATLEPITPLGRLDDYRPVVEFPRGFNEPLCPLTITSAHPPYDARTGEYYGLAASIVPLANFCDIVLWDGEGSLRSVPVVRRDGRPIHISQTAHQMCVTRDHLVILDAAITLEGGKLLNDPRSSAAGEVTAPRDSSHVFIIGRDDLRSARGAVVAAMADIPRESGHMMVDYSSSRGRLVVHLPHTPAMDVGEWTMPYDRHPHSGAAVPEALVGCISPVGYDAGVVGRYEIDATTGRILDQHTFTSEWTWGTGALTARNPLTPDDTLGDVFHANSGFPTDLAVGRVAGVFRDYRHRLVAADELPWAGVPSSLVRVDHDAGDIADAFAFPGDRFCWTVTFVPRNGTATGSADGYVVAVVFSDHVGPDTSGRELWIFDAARLSTGPLARLGHPRLAIPLTLHSTWLDSTASSRPDYRVDIEGELAARAATWRFDPLVADVLRTEVLPRL